MTVSNATQPLFPVDPALVADAAAPFYFELFRPGDLVNPVGAYLTLQEAVDAAQDGDRITVLAGAPTGGTVTVSVDNLTIAADAPYWTELTIAGVAETLSLLGTANLISIGSVLADTVWGNSGNESYLGMAGDDHAYGLEGNDTLQGRSGDDVLDGGVGNDLLGGDAGNDSLYGGQGWDGLYGGAGDDLLSGAGGNDTLNGGDGFDTADYAGVSLDLVINLNTGVGRVVGTSERDILFDIEAVNGGSGDDILVGSAADNILLGFDGNDEIYGLAGADSIDGGNGNDTIEGSGGNDTLNGGAGIDTVSFYHAGRAMVVDLYWGFSRNASGGVEDRCTGFENIFGSQNFGDTLMGSTGNNALYGFGGNDTLYGSQGDDTLYGMQGDDVLDGGPGNDMFIGGGGADSFQFRMVHWIEGATIVDFEAGTDVINLAPLDADLTDRPNDAFTFIGSEAFSEGVPGELRFVTDGTDSIVQASVFDSTSVTFEIVVLGVTSMSASDFIL